jgi:branched-chain amino acid transport system permease protein
MGRAMPYLVRVGVPLLLLVLLPLVLWALGSAYYGRIAQLVLITVILTSALNLLMGTAGLLSLDTVLFYGLGAYTAAILSVNFGTSFLVDLAAAVVLASVIGFILGFALVRLTSIFFAVATMALAVSFHTTALNWDGLTRGSMGYRGIPPIELFGFAVDDWLGMYLATAAICLAALYVVHRLTHSFYGNAVRAVREDEACARSMGLSTRWLRVQIYVAHAAIIAAAGVLYAHTNQFIGPDNFVLLESALVLTGVVVGGVGSLPGAALGALMMVLVPELLRDIGHLRALVFGFILFFSILFLRRGLLSEVRALAWFRRAAPEGAWARRKRLP